MYVKEKNIYIVGDSDKLTSLRDDDDDRRACKRAVGFFFLFFLRGITFQKSIDLSPKEERCKKDESRDCTPFLS